MIIIAGTLPMDPDQLEGLQPELAALIEATTSEAGCRLYTFAIDPAEPGLLRIFEVWDSDEALAAHARSDHVRRWVEVSKGAVAGRLDLTRYVATEATPYP